jgi:hypothetical protein
MWTPQNRKPYDRSQLRLSERPTTNWALIAPANRAQQARRSIQRAAINRSRPPRAPDASGAQSESVGYTIAFGPLLHTPPADIQDRDGGILPLATLFGRYPL